MNEIKSEIEHRAKESANPAVPYYLMCDSVPNICRGHQIVSNEPDYTLQIHPLGVRGGGDWKLVCRLNDTKLRRISQAIKQWLGDIFNRRAV